MMDGGKRRLWARKARGAWCRATTFRLFSTFVLAWGGSVLPYFCLLHNTVGTSSGAQGLVESEEHVGLPAMYMDIGTREEHEYFRPLQHVLCRLGHSTDVCCWVGGRPRGT